MNRVLLRLPLAALMLILASCVSVSRREGAEHVQSLVEARVANTRLWKGDNASAAIDARLAELIATPLTVESARQIAVMRNPQIVAEYARLGIAQADVVDASRIANPSFGGSALRDGGPAKITMGLSLPLADLLLLPSRRRFAEAGYVRAQQLIAAQLITLASDISQAWYEAAGAQQVAAMRDAVSRAAAASAELARRYHEAGNISALEFELEQAAASQARLASAAARAESVRARLALNSRMGLSGAMASNWTLDVPLAAPASDEEGLETLQSLARENRLDLLAAHRQVDLLEDVVDTVKRWRLIGNIDVGVERERESDGARLTGPTLSLAVPLFNQGQAAVARAEAQLEVARGDLALLELQIDNEVRLGKERVSAMRDIAEDYRVALVPQREAIVRYQAERNNYMLIGAFELLRSRQQEFDAYEGYLDAVRDYWVARNELSKAIGTSLPSDASVKARVIGVDAILAPPVDPGMQHGQHGETMPEAAHDDHSGHDMSKMTPTPAAVPAPHRTGPTSNPDLPPRDTGNTDTAEPVTDPPQDIKAIDHHGHEGHEPMPTPSPAQTGNEKPGELP